MCGGNGVHGSDSQDTFDSILNNYLILYDKLLILYTKYTILWVVVHCLKDYSVECLLCSSRPENKIQEDKGIQDILSKIYTLIKKTL